MRGPLPEQHCLITSMREERRGHGHQTLLLKSTMAVLKMQGTGKPDVLPFNVPFAARSYDAHGRFVSIFLAGYLLQG